VTARRRAGVGAFVATGLVVAAALAFLVGPRASSAPDGLEKVFFTNGGAEATENAMRMARAHTGRQKILAMYRSYHGSTSGSIAENSTPCPTPPGS